MNEYIEATNSFEISTSVKGTVGANYTYDLHCIICGEVIPQYYGDYIQICDRCKKAVLYIRNNFTDIEKDKNINEFNN